MERAGGLAGAYGSGAAALLLAAAAGSAVTRKRAAAGAMTCAVLVACAGGGRAPVGRWQSSVATGHPLAGRVWDVSARRYIEGDALIERLSRRRLVLLGEKHDNADHHRLQARVIEGLVGAGRRPAVALEMLSADLEGELAELRARNAVSASDLREAVRWDERGWPDWSLYAPIVEAALRAELPIVAADLDSKWLAALRSQGLAGLAPELAARLLDAPLSSQERRALADQVREVHCGHAPEAMVERMVDVQVARDAQLARALFDASGETRGEGAVLIAGTEHVRRDVAAPRHLARWAPELTLASVAFLEVGRERNDPREDLAARYGESVPFDYVWYTPRVDELDPCEKFARELERLERGAEGAH